MKRALVSPGGMTTLSGTAAVDGSPLQMRTTAPFLGAALPIVTDASTELPAETAVELRLSDVTFPFPASVGLISLVAARPKNRIRITKLDRCRKRPIFIAQPFRKPLVQSKRQSERSSNRSAQTTEKTRACYANPYVGALPDGPGAALQQLRRPKMLKPVRLLELQPLYFQRGRRIAVSCSARSCCE